MQKIIAETAGRPDQFVVTSNWGSMLPQLGQIQLAKITLRRAADQAGSVNEKDAEAASLLGAASADGWSTVASTSSGGRRGREIGQGQGYADHSRQHPGRATSRSTPTRCSRILKSIIRKTRSIREITVPQARAWLAIKAGDAQTVIAQLEKVRAHDDASFAP